MKRFRILIAGLLCIIPLFLFASISPQEITDSLSTRYKNLKTISADIEQTLYKNGTKYFYKGHYLAKEGKAYIEYEKPYYQQIWSFSDSVLWYVPLRKIVYYASFVNKGESSVNSDVKSIIGQAEKDLKNNLKFSVKEAGVIRKRYVVSVIPKNREKNRAGIQLILDKNFYLKDYIVFDNNAREVIHFKFSDYEDVNGIYIPKRMKAQWFLQGVLKVDTRYKNIKVNADIVDTVFVPKIPEGIERKALGLF